MADCTPCSRLARPCLGEGGAPRPWLPAPLAPTPHCRADQCACPACRPWASCFRVPGCASSAVACVTPPRRGYLGRSAPATLAPWHAAGPQDDHHRPRGAGRVPAQEAQGVRGHCQACGQVAAQHLGQGGRPAARLPACLYAHPCSPHQRQSMAMHASRHRQPLPLPAHRSRPPACAVCHMGGAAEGLPARAQRVGACSGQ